MKKLFILILILINVNASNLSRDVDDFLLDWDKAHNNKDLNLFWNLYANSLNYYNNIGDNKLNVINDKDKILKKYPDFQQRSILVNIENLDNNLKVYYDKETYYNNKKRVFPSYLILSKSNESFKVLEENDYKKEVVRNYKTPLSKFNDAREVDRTATFQDLSNFGISWINTIPSTGKNITVSFRVNYNTSDGIPEVKILVFDSQVQLGEKYLSDLYSSMDGFQIDKKSIENAVKSINPNIKILWDKTPKVICSIIWSKEDSLGRQCFNYNEKVFTKETVEVSEIWRNLRFE